MECNREEAIHDVVFCQFGVFGRSVPLLRLVHCGEVRREIVGKDCGDGTFDVPVECRETGFYKPISKMG